MTQQNQPVNYGFDQETPEQLGASPIPAGINEKVGLVKVVYEPAKEGSNNMCLAFYFKNKKGQQLRHTEWPIDVEETQTRAMKQGNDPQQAVQKRVRAQGVRIKHIVTKIIPAERAVVKGVNTFEQYAHAVVKLLRPHLPAGPFWLKVLLNDKNDYSTLPPYTPFIEKQEEGKPTTLKIDKGEKILPAGQGGGTQPSLDMPSDLPAAEDLPPEPETQAPQQDTSAPQTPNLEPPGDDDLPF